MKRNNGWWDFKGTWATTEEEWEVNARPEELNKDGHDVTFTHTGKFTPNAKDGDAWEGSLGVQAGGFELGPILPYICLLYTSPSPRD